MFIGTIGLTVVMNISFMCVFVYETRKEKKRVEKELLSTFQDETIIVLADWLKVFYIF